MGRLVGVGAKKVVKSYTEEEVKELTAELEVKVQEVTEEVDSLTKEKAALEAKVQEVTDANNALVNDKKELEKQVKALTKENKEKE